MHILPATTREYQRGRHNSRISLAAISRITEQSDNIDMKINRAFFSRPDDGRTSRSSLDSIVTCNTMENLGKEDNYRNLPTPKTSIFHRYHWKMTHYFYLHLAMFIFNGFFGGLIVWLIENHSSARNTYMEVSYLDAWFTTVSCICSCGLITIDFAKLSRPSHIVLMCLAFISGFAISTLPALIIKTHTHKTTQDLNVDDDNDDRMPGNCQELRTRNLRYDEQSMVDLRDHLKLLPTPTQLRYRAYITSIILILSIYCFIYTSGFIAMGVWLEAHDKPEYLLQNNATYSPWFISCMLTLFSFNQNGLTPFSTNMARFVEDIYINIVIIMVMHTFVHKYCICFSSS